MAIKFADVNGENKKVKVDYYKFKDGDNEFRIVGDIEPMYVYWLDSADGNKTIPVECLAYNRDKEIFDNVERDAVKEFFPDMNCSWSYRALCFDPDGGKIKVLSLKKKFFTEQLLPLAKKHFGDITDQDDGWKIVVNRTGTGFGTAYMVDQLSCEKQPLTNEQKEAFDAHKKISEVFPRQSYADQKSFIEKFIIPKEEETEDAKTQAEKDFEDDIPM
jgi:hypothetical protein